MYKIYILNLYKLYDCACKVILCEYIKMVPSDFALTRKQVNKLS